MKTGDWQNKKHCVISKTGVILMCANTVKLTIKIIN